MSIPRVWVEEGRKQPERRLNDRRRLTYKVRSNNITNRNVIGKKNYKI